MFIADENERYVKNFILMLTDYINMICFANTKHRTGGRGSTWSLHRHVC